MSISVAEYGGGKIPGYDKLRQADRRTQPAGMNLKEWKEQDLKLGEGPAFSLYPSAVQKCAMLN